MTTFSVGSSIIGAIDGKLESGYIVSVTMGSEELKGVLYHAPPQNPILVAPHQSASTNNNSFAASLSVHCQGSKKKSEIQMKDSALPKHNRSGYNFFFAEQYARLKLLYQGKEKEISKVIGEQWSKLKESEKTVYQEKAMKDEERYIVEMSDYQEQMKMSQVIIDAVPLQQWPPKPNTDMEEAEAEEANYGRSDYEYYNKAEERGCFRKGS